MTWRLEVTLGDLELEAVPRDPTDTPPALPALLHASWFDSLVDDGGWPAIQEVSTGQLRVAFDTAAEAAAVDATTPVSMRLYRGDPADTLVAWFAGRTTDPEIEPWEGDQTGVVATFGLADYLADLAEHTRGDEFYPQHNVMLRIDRMFTDAGLIPPVIPAPYGASAFTLAARDPSPASLLELAQEAYGSGMFKENALDPDEAAVLFELRPNVDAATFQPDPDEPWTQTVLTRTTDSVPESIDATSIEFGGRWQRSKFSDVNTVHVTTPDGGVVRVNNRDDDDRRVLYRRESQLLSAGTTARILARYLLPDPTYIPGWEADTFTIHPDRIGDDWWPGTLRDVRQLTNLQTRHNPDGTSTWTGVVTALETIVDSGRLTVALNLSSRPTGDLDLDGLHADSTVWDLDPFDGGTADQTVWDFDLDLGDAAP